MKRMKINAVVGGTLLVRLFTYSLTLAAEYPTRPVQMLVGYTAGGPSDLSARVSP